MGFVNVGQENFTAIDLYYEDHGSGLPVVLMGEISDIVGAILYLESAGFVTGEAIHVDGGQSAGH